MSRMAYGAAHDERHVQHVPGVDEKKMFGSVEFLVHGKMCVNARGKTE